MDSRKETPEELVERLRKEELKSNPFGAFTDGLNRAEYGNLGALGWKGTGVVILLFVIGYIIYKLLN